MADVIVFLFEHRRYRMPVQAMAMFKYIQEERIFPEWRNMQGCDACGTVCMPECLCKCRGHADRRARGDDDYGTHRSIATIAEVIERLRISAEGAA
jgi:hypothetical protein